VTLSVDEDLNITIIDAVDENGVAVDTASVGGNRNNQH
jgi:hypothetical protein